MYSAAMFKSTNRTKLEFIFSELKNLDGKMHFVLEAKTIKNLYEVKSLLFSYSLKNMFDNMYQLDIASLRKLI